MGTTWVAMIRMPFSQADGESGLSVVGVKTPRSQGSKGEGASLTVLPTPTSTYSSGLASYHGFNLDVEEPLVFREDGAGFGQSVVQFDRSR